ARAQVEAHLPVVDVEQERPAPDEAEKIAHARGGEPRLRGDDQIAVGAPVELRSRAYEGGKTAARHARVAHRARGHGSPDPRSCTRTDHLDGAEWLQKSGEEIGASGRVVAQVEAEDGDLHAGRTRRR